MLEKKYVKSRNVCKVTFLVPTNELPADIEVTSITVAGIFNDWDVLAAPMKFSKKKQAYSATLELDPETDYEYRYVINGDLWHNDWAADAYCANHIDSDDNCIVTTLGPA